MSGGKRRRPSPDDVDRFLDEAAPSARQLARARRRASEAIRQRDQAFRELALEQQRLELYEATDGQVITPIKPKRANRKQAEAVALSVASDWHVGEVVDPVEVDGVNAFNKAVCRRRAGNYWEGLAWKLKAARKVAAVDELVLAINGDIINGAIHEELADTNDMTPAEQIVESEWLIASGLDYVAAELPDLTIHVYMKDGNHDRSTKKNRFKAASRYALSWVLYQNLRRRYEGHATIRAHVAEGILTHVPVFDFTVRLTHGHTIRGGAGVGGIAVPILRRCHKWDRHRRADFTFLGHFHQLSLFGHVGVNGSLKGYDEYAAGNGFAPEPPRQIFCLLDRDHGLRQWDAIWV